MKILYIILFIQIGWIFPLSAQKQDSIYIGTRHTLFSEILNEERKYWIYVPETKAGEKGKAYPVLYLLDGDSFFHSVVGFTRFFSSSKTSNLPPCIVVAVLNTEISLLPAQPPAGMVLFVPMISRQVVELNSSIAF